MQLNENLHKACVVFTQGYCMNWKSNRISIPAPLQGAGIEADT